MSWSRRLSRWLFAGLLGLLAGSLVWVGVPAWIVVPLAAGLGAAVGSRPA